MPQKKKSSKTTNKNIRTAKSAGRMLTKAYKQSPVLFWVVIALLLVTVILAVVLGSMLAPILKPDNVAQQNSETTPKYDKTKLANKVVMGDVEDPQLEVHFIDVLCGDSILLKYSNGTNVMFDAGSAKGKKPAAEYIGYLNSIGLVTLDYLIITHPDTDHYNLADDVINHYDVKNIILNGCKKNTTYSKFLDLAKKETQDNNGMYKEIAPMGEDYTITVDVNNCISIYAPGQDRIGNNDGGWDDSVSAPKPYSSSTESNAMSLISIVNSYGKKIFLAGDAIIKTEMWWIEKMKAEGHETYDCDILKAGHHGSNTSTSYELLDYITCEFSVVMVDDGSAHGLPDETTMERLDSRGVPTYTTNTHGNIVLFVDAKGNYGFLLDKEEPAFNNSQKIQDLRVLPKP